jgi:hypothetical protein
LDQPVRGLTNAFSKSFIINEIRDAVRDVSGKCR